MRMAILGSGRMGLAAARNLAGRADVTGLTLADADESRAANAARVVGPKATAARLDAKSADAVAALLAGHAAAVSAVPYAFAPNVARGAIAARTHLVDLGGSLPATRALLQLHAEAERAGIGIVPDIGLAPGLTNILGAACVAGLDRCRAVRIRVGGLPQKPRPPLDYRLVFSARGLLNEYLGRSRILRGGRETEVEALSEIEHDAYPGVGRLEAFHTVGGTSMLPDTLRGRVKDLDEKTLRYPGHRDRIALLLALGLGSEDPVTTAAGVRVPPRDVLEAVLERTLPDDGHDLVVMRVEGEGTRNGKPARIRYEMLDKADPQTGLSAMQRTTGFPAAAVAYGLATGAVPLRGAAPPETAVPVDWLLADLATYGVRVTMRRPAASAPPRRPVRGRKRA